MPSSGPFNKSANMSLRVEAQASRTQSSIGESRSLFQLGGYCLVLYGFYNLFIILLSQGNSSQELTTKISAIISLFPVIFIGSLFTLLGPISDGILVRWAGFQQLVRYFVLIMAIFYLIFTPFSLFTIYNIGNINSNSVKRLSTRLEQRKDEILKTIATISDNTAFGPALSQFPELSANIYLPPDTTPSAVREAISNGIQQGIDAQIRELKQSQISASIKLRRVCRSNAISSLICGFSFLALASRVFPWLMSALLKLRQFKSSVFPSSTSQSSRHKPSAFSKMVQKWKDDRRRRKIYLNRRKEEERFKKKARKQ